VSALDVLFLVCAGVGGGLAGSIAGLASLVSYPALLAAGLDPVEANVTNTVALVFSTAGSMLGSRVELQGQGAAVVRLGVAAVAGGAAGAALSSHEGEIRVVAAIVVAAIAVHGLIALAREQTEPGAEARSLAWDEPSDVCAVDERSDVSTVDSAAASHGSAPRAHFARFLAITATNPLTIASFAAVAAALSLDGPLAAAAFAAGVGIASAAWHALLTLAAGHAGRWMTRRVRRGFAVAGRLAVLAIAAHLALG
jgi:hypothetical protein